MGLSLKKEKENVRNVRMVGWWRIYWHTSV
jgi:hypothetical protein